MSKVMEFLMKSGSIQKRGKGLEKGLESDINGKLIAEYFGDDSKTHYKIGDKIEKATHEWGDIHELGRPGVVVGAMLDNGREIYMVKFEGDGEDSLCMTLPYKLRAID